MTEQYKVSMEYDKPPPKTHKIIAEELSEDVEAFLNNGGFIEHSRRLTSAEIKIQLKRTWIEKYKEK